MRAVKRELEPGGSHSRYALEYTGEILRIIKGERVRDLREIHVVVSYKLLCTLDFDLQRVACDGISRLLSENLGEVALTVSECRADVADMETFLDLVLYLLFNCYNKVIFHFFLGGEDVGLSLFRHFAQEEDQELLKVGFDELLAADVGVFLDQRVK